MLKIISASRWLIDLQPILINCTSKVITINKVYLLCLVVESTKRRISIQAIEYLERMLTLKTVLEVQVVSANMVRLAQHRTCWQVIMVMIKVKIKLLISHILEKIEIRISDQLFIIYPPHLIDDATIINFYKFYIL